MPIYFFVFLDHQNEEENHQFWVITTILIFGSIPSLPLLLILTVKQKKAKQNQTLTQPPHNLQYHDNGVDSQQGISHPLQFHQDFSEEEEHSFEQLQSVLPNQIPESRDGQILNVRRLV